MERHARVLMQSASEEHVFSQGPQSSVPPQPSETIPHDPPLSPHVFGAQLPPRFVSMPFAAVLSWLATAVASPVVAQPPFASSLANAAASFALQASRSAVPPATILASCRVWQAAFLPAAFSFRASHF